MSEIFTMVQMRPAFAKFAGAGIVPAHGVFALDSACGEARDALVADLRDDGYKLLDIQLRMGALHSPPPLVISNPAIMRKSEEVDIPKKAIRRAADIGRLDGLINPDQLSAGAISGQLPISGGGPAVYAVSAI